MREADFPIGPLWHCPRSCCGMWQRANWKRKRPTPTKKARLSRQIGKCWRLAYYTAPICIGLSEHPPSAVKLCCLRRRIRRQEADGGKQEKQPHFGLFPMATVGLGAKFGFLGAKSGWGSETSAFLSGKGRFLTKGSSFLSGKSRNLSQVARFLTEKSRFPCQVARNLSQVARKLSGKTRFLCQAARFPSGKSRNLSEFS